MPRHYNNWKYRDVERVLKQYSFRLIHARGSHYYFIGVVRDVAHQVCVPYHGSVAIKPKTMKSIVLQSGLSEKEWGI